VTTGDGPQSHRDLLIQLARTDRSAAFALH
jgi:hypothetical protein